MNDNLVRCEQCRIFRDSEITEDCPVCKYKNLKKDSSFERFFPLTRDLTEILLGFDQSIISYVRSLPRIIFERTRGADIIRMKVAAIVVLREQFELSYPRIGEIFGLDHTTIVHHYHKFKGRNREQ